MTYPELASRASHVRAVLRQRAAAQGAPFEAIEGVAGEADVHPDDVLSRLEQIANRMPPDEVTDPEDFKRALQTLIDQGAPALKKILLPHQADARALTRSDLLLTEAIVIVDGTRPSFLLRGGEFAADHPFLGAWRDDMTHFRPALRKLAACVGRLQVPDGNASQYNGTGTLVDAADGLVLTNFHVVEHARNNSRVAMTRTQTGWTVIGDWVIDFAGESGSTVRNRWRVKEVRLPAGAGVSFDGLDAAVLRIEPFDAEESKPLAQAITLSSEPDYATGTSATLVTIGFPGAPDTSNTDGNTVDWAFVTGQLFNNRFGLKRVAPGRFGMAPGSVPQDRHKHSLSHDATTFGGASGSLLFAWKDSAQPAFGLHFAGQTLTANYAVSLHKAAKALRACGLTIA